MAAERCLKPRETGIGPGTGMEDAGMSRWTLSQWALSGLPSKHSRSAFSPIQSRRGLLHSGMVSAAMAALLMVGCGGGGGSSSGSGGGHNTFSAPPNPAQYAGSTDPAALTSRSAESFTANILGVTDVSTGFAAASVAQADPTQFHAPTSVVGALIDLSQRPTAGTAVRRINGIGISAQAVSAQQETFECEDGGHVTETQAFDDAANITTITDDYWNCYEAGELTHGTIITRIYNNEPGRMDVEIPALRDLSDGDDLTYSGSITAVTVFPSGTRVITANLTIEDHVARDAIKIDGLEMRVLTTYTTTDATRSIEIAGGRIYLSEYGYVSVRTATPLLYPGPDFLAPDSGGPLVLTGASPATVSVTPHSISDVILALDENGDGSQDRFSVLPYSVLGEGAATPAAPIARISGPASIPRNVSAEIDGSASTDANHDLLSFAWKIEAAPVGSTASLDTSAGWKAGIVPDREGEYRIALSVSDGANTHRVVHVLTAVNVAPTAKASVGQYAVASVGETASLDGSGSSDVNGDAITYSWSIKSRPIGSLATMESPSARNAAFAPDKAGIYVLQLVVSDGRLTESALVQVAVTSAFTPVCSSDEVAGMPTAGYLRIPNAEGQNFFSSLCSGWVLIRDSQRNGISIQNVFTGREKEFIGLSNTPEKIAYDPVGGLLYISFKCTPSLTIMNLATRQSVIVPLPGAAVAIAPTDDAHVFVSYESATQVPLANGIVYVDSISGSALQNLQAGYTHAMLFNRAVGALFADQSGSATGGAGISTSCFEAPPAGDRVTRYRLDGAALIEEQAIQRTYPLIPINISRDGRHGVFTHGVRSIEDRSPTDFNRVQGIWDFSAGDYPQYATATAFQPQGKYVAISVDYDRRVQLFHPDSHAHVARLPLSITDTCGPINEMEFSSGGNVLFGRSFACPVGSSAFEDHIHWWVVPD